MASRMAEMPYVKGKNGYTAWKKPEVISMGYNPVAPGICANTSTMQMPLPMCCSVTDNA